MEKIHWHDLSKTFQDAIVLTRNLGYQYIWIDSLCIIQDDEVDWQIESSKMADIYENAAVTISANTAKDGSGGLFTDRYQLDREGNRYEVASIELKSQTEDGQPVSIFARRPLTTVEYENENLPLFGRAWTFQERLLSRRVVHFNRRELMWECNGCVHCECGSGRNRQGIHGAQANFQRLFPSASATSQQQQISRWRTLVTEYSGKLLKKPSDRLPALSGVAKRLQKTIKSEYLAGIWEVDLPGALLWSLTTPVAAAVQIDPRLQRSEYRAPTWSWASLSGTSCTIDDDSKSYTYHTTVESAKCVPKGKDRTGQVSHG